MIEANEKKRIRFKKETLDFLYILGIQTVRVVKRFVRRAAIFFRPVKNMVAALYNRYLKRRIDRLVFDITSLCGSFRREAERFHRAKKEGRRRPPVEIFHFAKKGAHNHKRLLCGVINIAAPVICIGLLGQTILYWQGLDFGLNLMYNGQSAGVIQSETVYETAVEMFNGRMVYEGNEKTGVTMTPSFRLAVTDGERYTAATDLCDLMIRGSDDIVEEATGLYVDGNLLGAVRSSADLNFILQNLLNTACGGDKTAQAKFVQNVQTITGLFPTGSIVPAETINNVLQGETPENAVYTVQLGDTATSIAQKFDLSLTELDGMNGGEVGDLLTVGDELTVKTQKAFLSVEVTKEETYESEIAYSTVTERDENEYTDYSQVIQEGENGLAQCVDKVVYVDGTEVSRESVSRTTIEEPVDKIVVVGTKKRPVLSGVGTGEIIWPVPEIHRISSLFEWRWGTMHNGIDISNGNSYGKTIVAADSGTVSYVRYSNVGYGNHVEIDHGNGMKTMYAHASRILVESGQKVAKGQPIALVGSTGDSTGNHLHFEVIVNGSRVNPLNYVSP